MNSLKLTPLKTRIFRVQESLLEFILSETPKQFWREELILTITSKVISLHEGRLVDSTSVNKKELIQSEAEHYLGEMAYGCHLTVKQGQLLATAGIDESNSEKGEYILYPLDPYASAHQLRQGLQDRLGLKKLGVVITDSHSRPLRHGVMGSCVAVAGFQPVRSRVGDVDIFKRPLKMTKQNLADGLAAAAVLLMGEADELCPLVFIEGAKVEFTDEIIDREKLEVPLQDDIYFPLYKNLISS